MPTVAKSTRASLDPVQALTTQQLTGDILAGENLPTFSPCYIASDGKAMLSDGSAAGAAAVIDGWTAKDYQTGEPVALLGRGNRGHYSDGNLTPGQNLFLGAGAGLLADAATTGGTEPVARAISATDIYVLGGC